MNNNYLTGLDPNLYGLTSPQPQMQPQNNVGYQQPVMNQAPLGQRSNSPVFNIINSEMEFNAQVVLPGLTVFSYSPNENRLFIKTNPGNGMPPQSRYFNCVEYFCAYIVKYCECLDYGSYCIRATTSSTTSIE